MQRGAFQTSREIFNNDIWLDVTKFRLFFYIVGNAVFAKEGIKHAGMKLDRGQYLRSYRNLQRDLEYLDNRSIKQYSLSVIKTKVDQLIREERIEIESTELGTLFTVVNYEQYQGFEGYTNGNLERTKNGERTHKERSENNNKNVKNDKNVKKKDIPSFPKEQEIYDYYISKDIIKHQEFTPAMKSKVTTALKKRSVEELKVIIDNYATVYKSNKYYFNTMYSLEKIMRPKDLNQFSDEEKPLYNFLIDKSSGSNSNVKPKQIEIEPVMEKWGI